MISKPGLVTIKAALSALILEGDDTAAISIVQKRVKMALTEVQRELDAKGEEPKCAHCDNRASRLVRSFRLCVDCAREIGL